MLGIEVLHPQHLVLLLDRSEDALHVLEELVHELVVFTVEGRVRQVDEEVEELHDLAVVVLVFSPLELHFAPENQVVLVALFVVFLDDFAREPDARL